MAVIDHVSNLRHRHRSLRRRMVSGDGYDGGQDMEQATSLINEPVQLRPRPVLACVDGEIVGDCVVIVSEDDPNWWRSMAVRNKGAIKLKGGRRVL
jgi:hypothetical protein